MLNHSALNDIGLNTWSPDRHAPGGHRLIFYYDCRSNVTCVRDPDLGLTYYTYDAGSRVASVANPFGEVSYYEYTPGGRLTKRVLGNGCVTYYDYDAIGRTTEVDNRTGDLTTISSFEYERDAVGNPVCITREDGSATYYDYDGRHQLVGETQVDNWGMALYAYEWDYDAAGNREHQVFGGEATYYQYNAGNELLEETTAAQTTYYHYDRSGNTVAQQAPSGTTYFDYDFENHMMHQQLESGGHSYHDYDADGKRVLSRPDNLPARKFIYQGPDMLRLMMERDENGKTKAHYTMGLGLEALRRDVGSGMASGESSFYHYDWLGSTQQLTDPEEAVTDAYRYNAWGVRLASTGSTVNPHTYVGRERYFRMPDAGFYHLGFRDYSQRAGRFTTTDPIRYGANWFGYVGERPTMAVDPSGLQTPDPPTFVYPPECGVQPDWMTWLPGATGPGLYLLAGSTFGLDCPEMVPALAEFEGLTRSFANRIQDWAACRCWVLGFAPGKPWTGQVGNGTVGPLQISPGTIWAIENSWFDTYGEHDMLKLREDIKRHLRPRSRRPQERVLRALNPHTSAGYLAAYIYIYEKVENHDSCDLVGFVKMYWNSNPKYVERLKQCAPALMAKYRGHTPPPGQT